MMPKGRESLMSAKVGRRKNSMHVRSIQEFMEDQIKFDHRRYENLKSAIMEEEASEINSFQPEINQNSVRIL